MERTPIQASLKRALARTLRWPVRTALRRRRPLVVGITGTVGKTSTARATEAVLARRGSVSSTRESYNSEMSVLLAILGKGPHLDEEELWRSWRGRLRLGLRGGRVLGSALRLACGGTGLADALVLELGISRPGAAEAFVRLTGYDVVVITALGEIPVHVESFEGPAALRAAKLRLLGGLRAGGTFVYNRDDPELLAAASRHAGTAVSYGFSSGADLRATDYRVAYREAGGHRFPAGIRMTLESREQRMAIDLDGVLGRSYVYAFLAASCVAAAAGVSLPEVPGALTRFCPAEGRMRIVPAPGPAVVLDDSYNSSPLGARAALAALCRLEARRKLAILGDMFELGVHSERAHRSLAAELATGIDRLVCVGPRAALIADEAARRGVMHQDRIDLLPDAAEAAKRARELLEPGDVILVKGSRALRMERVVQALIG